MLQVGIVSHRDDGNHMLCIIFIFKVINVTCFASYWYAIASPSGSVQNVK